MRYRIALAAALAALLSASVVEAQSFKSYTSGVTGGTVIDFEGMAEGTLIDTQYAGVTFGQAPLAGRPMIDNSPAIFGYGFSSGEAVLTGSTEGGYPYPTVAGITASFASPVSSVEAFLSDSAPLGDYTVSIFDSSSMLLDSIVVLGSEILPPGYSGGVFPSPGTFPLPGIFVGFNRMSADIASIQFGPSTADGDAFAIDDLRYVGGQAVPEPGSLALLIGAGIGGSLLARRRRAR